LGTGTKVEKKRIWGQAPKWKKSEFGACPQIRLETEKNNPSCTGGFSVFFV
jgi:hypothetical protein